jgi:hypothetical protein
MKNTDSRTDQVLPSMSNEEARDILRGMILDWNNLTDEQRAEASAIAAEQAALALMDQQVNRAIGLQYDWATGEWR